MSSHRLEIISPDKLTTSLEVKWELCFICQSNSDNDDLQDPTIKRGMTYY